MTATVDGLPDLPYESCVDMLWCISTINSLFLLVDIPAQAWTIPNERLNRGLVDLSTSHSCCNMPTHAGRVGGVPTEKYTILPVQHTMLVVLTKSKFTICEPMSGPQT